MATETMRLDDPGASYPYLYDTGQWVHRCAKRILELDPGRDPMAVMHTVDDMATIVRWRLMWPESAAEALFGPGADSEAPTT